MIRARFGASLKTFGVVADALVVALVIMLSDFMLSGTEVGTLPLLIPVSVMSVALVAGYSSDLEDPYQTLGIRLLLASGFSVVLCTAIALGLGIPLPFKGFFAAVGCASVISIGWFTNRRLGLQLARQLIGSRSDRKGLVLVGTPDAVRVFMNDGDEEFEVLGWLTPPGYEEEAAGALGTFEALQAVVDENVVHEVLVLGKHAALEVSSMARICEEIGVDFSLDARFLGLDLAVARLGDYRGRPVLRFTTTPFPADALAIKRMIDVLGAAVGLSLLSPVMALAAFAIKFEDPSSPIFFRQTRSGMFGKPFEMWKFRTMVADAEARKAEFEVQNEMSGAAFKIADDPRITKVGRYLRKSSIDELPQLWNVLVGHMSLVGPRPLIPREEKGYQRWQLRRLSVRPGITGLWQVSGRNNVDFETWMLLDMQYLDNWTVGLDIRLLLKTIPAVISGAGAS